MKGKKLMLSNFNKFKESGEILFKSGLISLKAGNMSMKNGEYISITASGSRLGFLNREDIVKVDINTGLNLETDLVNPVKPSVEIEVHKSIYKNTTFKAVAHAHPPTATVISYGKKNFEFIDDEGRFYIPRVSVIKVQQSSIASGEVVRRLPGVIKEHGIVMVEGHGAFAAAGTLEGAVGLLSTLEHSSRILYKKKLLDS